MVGVDVQDLTVRYGTRAAVEECTWSARYGAVTALIGPNGAGKTTTMEACVGLRTPTAGRIRVAGADPVRWTPQQRSAIGVMLQGGGLPTSTRIVPWLTMVSKLFVDPWPVDALLEHLGIDPAWPSIRRLSGGQLQLVKLASAVVGRPTVLFLDEPTAGLDQQARTRLHDLVRGMRQAGTCVVLTTHDLLDVEQLADAVVVMQQGRLREQGTLAELTQVSAGLRFTAHVGLDVDRLRRALPPGMEITESEPGRYIVRGEITPSVMVAVTQWCADEGITASSLTTGIRSLADIVADWQS